MSHCITKSEHYPETTLPLLAREIIRGEELKNTNIQL